jgi:hypothetical protein
MIRWLGTYAIKIKKSSVGLRRTDVKKLIHAAVHLFSQKNNNLTLHHLDNHIVWHRTGPGPQAGHTNGGGGWWRNSGRARSQNRRVDCTILALGRINVPPNNQRAT